MTEEQEDLVFDIQELQIEIDEHTRTINQLKNTLARKEQQLKEMGIE